ncbi:MAG: methionine--tRNA ligase [Actinomycetota bacterium]
MSDSFYITTPIYYVNDVPHIGHAYTTVAADASARYHRLAGDKTYLLTGTDEHGEKIERAAREHGMSAKEWTDSMIPPWRSVWSNLDISYDDFIRTTEERHETPVKAFLQNLYDRGEVYLSEYEGPYCVSCEAFYAESELVDGNCPIHGTPVQRLKEENYFFRLSKQSDWLLNDYYARTPSPVQPEARLNEVVGHVRGGLQDVSVSRPSLEWGIPLPWDPKHVIYVWIEALQNYITALGYPGGDLFKTFWPAVHLVGKDILRFHAVIWPAMLHAAGEEPPRLVFAHGWLLVKGEKMSKTKLTGIHPDELLATFGVDAYRYYFLREIAFGQDGNFSWESMVARYNADLANGLGNLASRVLSMIASYFEGVVPEPKDDAGQDALEAAAAAALPAYQQGMESFAFHEALEAAFGIVREANGFLVATAPWNLAKDPSKRGELASVLWASAEALRVLAILLSPVMPGACERLWEQLGLPEKLADQRISDAVWGRLAPGTLVRKGDGLFPRIAEQS